MRAWTTAMIGVVIAGTATAQADIPKTFNEALLKGYQIASVVTRGSNNQDHVIYLSKADQVIECGTRFLIDDSGSRDRRSHSLGICSGVK